MKIRIELSEVQKRELEALLKRSAKPYIRERASAILQIAAGTSGKDVAFKGLLLTRRRNTVYDWVNRYKREGIKGLEIRKGRGRKPSFSPSESNCTQE